MIEIYSLFLIVQKIFRCIHLFNLTQLSPSIYLDGQLLNPIRKRWSVTFTQHEEWNEAPEL